MDDKDTDSGAADARVADLTNGELETDADLDPTPADPEATKPQNP